MSEYPGKRTHRLQFSLAAMFLLTAAFAVSFALVMVDRLFLLMWMMYAVIPFVVGVGVGVFCYSRAQLLTAPPVAAALAPLPWAILAAINETTLTGNPFLAFLRWWIMLFPVFLFLGAIPAIAGSTLAYWFKGRNIYPTSESALPAARNPWEPTKR